MRFLMGLVLVLGLAMTAAPAVAAAPADGTAVMALMQQPGQYSVDIDVNDGGAWWASPLWIGVGVVALLLLVVIIALATRGGGTTIIKE